MQDTSDLLTFRVHDLKDVARAVIGDWSKVVFGEGPRQACDERVLLLLTARAGALGFQLAPQIVGFANCLGEAPAVLTLGYRDRLRRKLPEQPRFSALLVVGYVRGGLLVHERLAAHWARALALDGVCIALHLALRDAGLVDGTPCLPKGHAKSFTDGSIRHRCSAATRRRELPSCQARSKWPIRPVRIGPVAVQSGGISAVTRSERLI